MHANATNASLHSQDNSPPFPVLPNRGILMVTHIYDEFAIRCVIRFVVLPQPANLFAAGALIVAQHLMLRLFCVFTRDL